MIIYLRSSSGCFWLHHYIVQITSIILAGLYALSAISEGYDSKRPRSSLRHNLQSSKSRIRLEWGEVGVSALDHKIRPKFVGPIAGKGRFAASIAIIYKIGHKVAFDVFHNDATDSIRLVLCVRREKPRRIFDVLIASSIIVFLACG